MPVLNTRFLRRSLPGWLGGTTATPGGRYSSLPGGENGDVAPPPAYGDAMAEKSTPAGGMGKPGVPLQEPPPSRAAVIGSVSFYLVAALVMVMVNKWVLNAVPVPLMFLLVQLLTAVLLLHITACFGFFKIPEMRLSTIKGLVPLISINCIGLAFNTYCLQYVDASFYQVARGLVLPFTVVFSYFLLASRPSMPVLFAIGIVCAGFVTGVAGEDLSVSALGIFLGVCSSVTTAGHAIVVKRSLPVVKGSAMDLAYYSNFLSSFVMLPAVLVAESGAVMDMVAEGGTGLRTFIVGGFVTGVFGFLICVAGFVSIKITSPITHMISAAVRGVIQTILGVWLFQDIVTSSRISSISIVLGGSILYTWLKDREMRQNAALQKQQQAIPLAPTAAIDMEEDDDADVNEADALIRETEREEELKREREEAEARKA